MVLLVTFTWSGHSHLVGQLVMKIIPKKYFSRFVTTAPTVETLEVHLSESAIENLEVVHVRGSQCDHSRPVGVFNLDIALKY